VSIRRDRLMAGKLLLPSNHHLNSCWEAAIRRLPRAPTRRSLPGHPRCCTRPESLKEVQGPLDRGNCRLNLVVTGSLAFWNSSAGATFSSKKWHNLLLVQTTPASRVFPEDGTLVAYSSDTGQKQGNTDIWVQSRSLRQPCSPYKEFAEDVDASISPDGSFIAFRSQRNGGGIYLVDVGGRG
jgi:hypothetical protein